VSAWRDRINQLGGRTRYVVCRLFLHLAGEQVVPLLGTLNQTAIAAETAEGDLQILGEGLVEVCQTLLQSEMYWQAAANQGEVFWEEGAAGDAINGLFTDSAQRYLSQSYGTSPQQTENDPLVVPITRHIVVMITVAYEGEIPELESDLSNIPALKEGLKSIINLHYQDAIRAIQIHFSPAQLGDELTADQILVNFPELIPL
jgi:uncharacterized membrane protein